jgi:hypothetical protein
VRKTETEILADALGRVLGRYEAPRRLSAKERAYASRFLANVTKQKGVRSMSKNKDVTAERTNMVFIAGMVQTTNMEAERAFFTLDVGLKQWVPCSIYKNDDLLKKLAGLYKGDFVQLKGLLQPWSKKNADTGEWDRGMNVEITEVKALVKGPGGPAKKKIEDDDIPF